MNRTLQLVGVHGLTSLRLTASRRYWLPRLTLAFIAAADLLTVMRDGDLHSWGPPASSLVLGVSCFSLCREDITGRTLPLPLPRHVLAVVSILAQLLVCIATVMALILTGAAIDVLLFDKTPEHLLSGAEVRLMLGITAAAIPFAAAIVFGWSHLRHPRHAWTNRAWHQVMPRLIAATAGFVGLQMAAEQLGAHAVVTRYLLIWAVASGLLSSAAVFYYGVTAVFPERTDLVRPARPAPLQLRRTVWRSQAIKWSVFLSGLALFLGTIDVVGTRARPILICYAALLPFFSMIGVSGGESIVGSRRVMGLWNWNHSGWRLVPVRRQHIQRLLLLDIIGFAVAATVLLHVAAWLVGGHAPINPNKTSWVYELHRFTWIFTWFTGCTLPAMVLFLIPRRRFGTGTAAVAIGATLWAMKSAIGGVLNLALPFDDHAIILASWVLLAGVMWSRFDSPNGRLFEPNAPATRWSEAVVSAIRRRLTRASVTLILAGLIGIGIGLHRSTMSESMNERIETLSASQTDRLIADLEQVAELDVFRNSTRDRDAGPLLNPILRTLKRRGSDAAEMPWWGTTESKQALMRGRAPGQQGTPWYEGPDGIAIGDLSILEALTAYDHWEGDPLPTSGVLGGESHLALNVDAPHVQPLLYLARYRLLEGLISGDIGPAFAEVRHLARLLHTDETTTGTLTAVGILRSERIVHEVATDRGLAGAENWVPVSEENLNAMTRGTVGLTMALAGGAAETEWSRLAALPFQPASICGAINEAMTDIQRIPLVSRLPGERFPEPSMKFLTHSLENTSCALPLTRHDHAAHIGRAAAVGGGLTVYASSAWRRLLHQELGRIHAAALAIPYLRGPAWMTTGVADRPVLMYGTTPEEDWRGPRARGEGSRYP